MKDCKNRFKVFEDYFCRHLVDKFKPYFGDEGTGRYNNHTQCALYGGYRQETYTEDCPEGNKNPRPYRSTCFNSFKDGSCPVCKDRGHVYIEGVSKICQHHCHSQKHTGEHCYNTEFTESFDVKPDGWVDRLCTECQRKVAERIGEPHE